LEYQTKVIQNVSSKPKKNTDANKLLAL